MMADPKMTLVERVRRRRDRHKKRTKFVRGLFALAGVVVTLGGLALLVLPGPAFLLLPVGLSLLALEFDWAERLLIKVVQRAEQAKASTDRISKGNKIIAGTILVLFSVSLGVAGYVWRNEIWAVLST